VHYEQNSRDWQHKKSADPDGTSAGFSDFPTNDMQAIWGAARSVRIAQKNFSTGAASAKPRERSFPAGAAPFQPSSRARAAPP
jgi:hypothetical protein